MKTLIQLKDNQCCHSKCGNRWENLVGVAIRVPQKRCHCCYLITTPCTLGRLEKSHYEQSVNQIFDFKNYQNLTRENENLIHVGRILHVYAVKIFFVLDNSALSSATIFGKNVSVQRKWKKDGEWKLYFPKNGIRAVTFCQWREKTGKIETKEKTESNADKIGKQFAFSLCGRTMWKSKINFQNPTLLGCNRVRQSSKYELTQKISAFLDTEDGTRWEI